MTERLGRVPRLGHVYGLGHPGEHLSDALTDDGVLIHDEYSERGSVHALSLTSTRRKGRDSGVLSRERGGLVR